MLKSLWRRAWWSFLLVTLCSFLHENLLYTCNDPAVHFEYISPDPLFTALSILFLWLWDLPGYLVLVLGEFWSVMGHIVPKVGV